MENSKINPEIRLRQVNIIPQELLEAFAKEIKSPEMVEMARTQAIKIGAFYGEKMIGFTCATPPNTSKAPILLEAPATYVLPQYRRKGIMRRLTFRLLGEAKKRKLDGLYLFRMREPTKVFLTKEARRRPTLEFKTEGSGWGSVSGTILFKKRRPR